MDVRKILVLIMMDLVFWLSFFIEVWEWKKFWVLVVNMVIIIKLSIRLISVSVEVSRMLLVFNIVRFINVGRKVM